MTNVVWVPPCHLLLVGECMACSRGRSHGRCASGTSSRSTCNMIHVDSVDSNELVSTSGPSLFDVSGSNRIYLLRSRYGPAKPASIHPALAY